MPNASQDLFEIAQTVYYLRSFDQPISSNENGAARYEGELLRVIRRLPEVSGRLFYEVVIGVHR
jgi:hypothetical protein